MSDTPPDPDKLNALGKRLDEVQRRRDAAKKPSPPTAMGIAFRLSTEMVSALAVGAGLGWGLDWLFGTGHILMIVMLVLGAAAGIRNVMSAARELNAQAQAATGQVVQDDDEEN